MKINFLLEELIDISKKQKTDFALSMNMTPSGLSKILTGKRLPNMKERKNFTKEAAEYFAEAIYAPGCYWKFESIFPVIYDFESKNDLESFLTYAIEYALDNDFTEENNINLDYAERGKYYLGKRPVLSLICIILSDYTVNYSDNTLELYVSTPLLDSSYYKIFQKIILTGHDKFKNVVLNYFFDKNLLNGLNNTCLSDLLSLIARLQKYFHINLWETTGYSSPFLLLKNHVLLLFNMQSNGIPLLAPIYHKSYLVIFYNNIMKKDTKKISYNREEAIRFLENNPQHFTELLDQGVDSVYNFISIGYLLEKRELEAAEGSTLACEYIWRFFNDILSKEATFVVSISAMEKFITFGKAIVPLIGTVYFPPKQRTSYLQRFNSYLSEDSYGKVKIIGSDLSNIAVFCFQDFSLLYTIDDAYENETLHVFETDRIKSLLYNETVKNNMSSMDFSADLWNAYQEELINAELI